MSIIVALAVIGLILFIAFKYNQRNQEPELEDPASLLSKFLSNGNQLVLDDVLLFQEDRDKYFEKYEDEFYECGIDGPDEISLAGTFANALIKSKTAICVDNRSDPHDVLEQLDELSGGQITKAIGYSSLEKEFKNSKYGIGAYFDSIESSPTIFECINSIGLKLLSVDNGSDAYILVLIKTENLEECSALAKQSGIRLFFEHK